MVDKEAKGTDAMAAHQEVEKEDSGLPTGALDKLPPAQRELVKHAFKSGALDCLGEGFRKGAVEVKNARTQAARKVLLVHQAGLQAAKEKYEAANPAPKSK
jgi:hypothetical protein